MSKISEHPAFPKYGKIPTHKRDEELVDWAFELAFRSTIGWQATWCQNPSHYLGQPKPYLMDRLRKDCPKCWLSLCKVVGLKANNEWVRPLKGPALKGEG